MTQLTRNVSYMAVHRPTKLHRLTQNTTLLYYRCGDIYVCTCLQISEIFLLNNRDCSYRFALPVRISLRSELTCTTSYRLRLSWFKWYLLVCKTFLHNNGFIELLGCHCWKWMTHSCPWDLQKPQNVLWINKYTWFS